MKIIIDNFQAGKSLEDFLELHSKSLDREQSYLITIDSKYVKPEDYMSIILIEGQTVDILYVGYSG